jgi:hypothetical protein
MYSVTAVSCYRLWTVWSALYGPRVPGRDPYHNITVTVSAVEPNLAIIAGSMPALRPLFRTWMGGSKTSKLPPNYHARLLQSDDANTALTIGGSRMTGHSGLHHQKSISGSDGMRQLGQLHLKGSRQAGHAECRRVSPNGSEVGIMSYNGIVRTTDVRVYFDAESALHDPDSDRTSRSSSEAKQKERRRPFYV